MPLPLSPVVLSAIACLALVGCASKPSVPAPRAAVVVEQRDAENGYDKTRAAVQSGRAAVIGGLMRHTQNGGSLRPWSVGPAVPGLVEEGKAGVDDACTRYVTIRYEDNGRQARLGVRCSEHYTEGQRVTVVMTPGKPDLRDAVRLVAEAPPRAQ